MWSQDDDIEFSSLDNGFLRHYGKAQGMDVCIDFFAKSKEKFTRKEGKIVMLKHLNKLLKDKDLMHYSDLEETIKESIVCLK